MIRISPLIVFFILTISGILQAGLPVPEAWLTKFEKSGYLETARYDETMAYFAKFEKNSPFVKMHSFGISPQGRELKVVIVSKDKAFTPEAARKTGKPIFVINNGIHAGEIEGKDASMLLLREMLITGEKAVLLDKVILLVIPIFSVDGHERFNANNRINQNGPAEMGWRTTAQNLNLNRDWIKADSPEMQAMLKLMSSWLPDFFVDCHTTDGADFQYAATYGVEKFNNIHQKSAEEVINQLVPYLVQHCQKDSCLIAPYVGIKDGDVAKGITDFPGSPRFSTGYFAAQNRIALLIETHMLKPYKQRVYATKTMLEATLQYVAEKGSSLRLLNEEADHYTSVAFSSGGQFYPTLLKMDTVSVPFLWRGYKHREENSSISGGKKVVFTNEKLDITVPYFNKAKVVDSVMLPSAYIIPQEYSLLADRLQLHGVTIRQLTRTQKIAVGRYRFRNANFNKTPYEGRTPVTFEQTYFTDTVEIAAGAYVVETNQRTARVIAAMLEPKSADSFVRWGFMNAIFEQKEYFEDYVMEKVAQEMINSDRLLAQLFAEKVKSDSAFAADPYKRLNFFYERSPFYDKKLNVYPILRVENKINLL